MTENQKHLTNCRDDAAAASRDGALKVVAVHPAWHNAAIHLARHHLAHLESYTYHPELAVSEVEHLLEEICSASGVDVDAAHKVAHELAQHVLPTLVQGRPVAVVVVIADAQPEPEHPETVLERLKQG